MRFAFPPYGYLANPRQQVAGRRVQEARGADDGLDRYPAGGGGAHLADDPGRLAVGAAPDDEQGSWLPQSYLRLFKAASYSVNLFCQYCNS